jgi:hypothetical protein
VNVSVYRTVLRWQIVLTLWRNLQPSHPASCGGVLTYYAAQRRPRNIQHCCLMFVGPCIIEIPEEWKPTRFLLKLLLAIRINTFYGIIWWCRTNIKSPSSVTIRAPAAKQPLLLHLRSSVSVVFAFSCFAFPGVATEVRWDVPLSTNWTSLIILLYFL